MASHQMTLARPPAVFAWGLPLLVAAIIMSVSLILAQRLARGEQERLHVMTDITCQHVARRLESWLATRARVIEHFGATWWHLRAGDREDYAREARTFLTDFPGYQAINWIDPGWVIRIIVPEQGNEPALDFDLHRHPNPEVRAALERAVQRGRMSSTPIIDLVQGGAGVATYQPVRDDQQRLVGFVNGVFRVDRIVKSCLFEPWLNERFRIAVDDNRATPAYRNISADGARPWPFEIGVPFTLVDQTWMLAIAPSQMLLAETLSHQAELLAACGLVAAFLVALLLRIYLLRNAALDQSRRLLQTVLDAIPVRVFWKTRDLTYLGCNREAARDAGLESPEEIVGKTDHEMAWRAQADLYRQDDRSVIESGRPMIHYDEPQEWPDGTQRWLRTSKLPLRDAQQRIIGVLGCYEDVTHERILEDRLRQAQKMEAVGQLAGGIAHDFNNILTTILGNVDLALEELGQSPASNETIESNLRAIEVGGEQAAALTRQLLAFARRDVHQPDILDLARVLASMREMLGRLLTESIELEISAEPEMPAIQIGAGQIEQVILNLAINARDAMPDGGKLSIRARPVDSRQIEDPVVWLSDDRSDPRRPIEPPGTTSRNEPAPSGPYVELTVEDTGCGMDEATRARIFEPFFTTKGLGQGTGLGLATVYGIVRQAGGLLALSSRPGQGTRFRVYLPACEGHAAQDGREDRAPDRDTGSELILLCEDDESVRNLACRFLEEAGYRVLPAGDGKEAVKIGRERAEEIDLLVTDVIMPDTNGKDLAERLACLCSGLRTLYISGYTANVIARHGVLENDVALLEKPFSRVDLLRRVREILDREP